MGRPLWRWGLSWVDQCGDKGLTWVDQCRNEGLSWVDQCGDKRFSWVVQCGDQGLSCVDHFGDGVCHGWSGGPVWRQWFVMDRPLWSRDVREWLSTFLFPPIPICSIPIPSHTHSQVFDLFPFPWDSCVGYSHSLPFPFCQC